jgi:HSP20 family protein
VARERDLLVNFERMRREMDELFGDVWGEGGWLSRRPQTGISPRVDVYYCGQPPRRS